MIGFSDLIQTMGAIVIFSLILLTANRMIQINTLSEVETEAIGIATTIAQGIIKEAQVKAFDNNTADGTIPLKIPEGFSNCGTGGGTRPYFDDFDDYDGYESYVNTERIKNNWGTNSFKISVKAGYVEPPDFQFDSNYCTDYSMFKKMVVTVTSKYLEEWNREIKLSYLRRFYKTTN